METIENKHIEWHEGHTPAQDGTYFVTGIGINNIEKMAFNYGKWSDTSKIPFGYGELDSPTYRMVSTKATAVSATSERARRARIEGLKQVITMFGTKKEDGFEVPIVNIYVYSDGHTECAWGTLDDVADDAVLSQFECLYASLEPKLKKAQRKNAVQAESVESPAETSQKKTSMTSKPVQQETLLDDAATEEPDIMPGEDDDVPF